MASGLQSSGPSGPSELEKVWGRYEMAMEHPWMLDWLANPGAIIVQHQWHHSKYDTPPASVSMICDALPLLPRAAPNAKLNSTTLERPLEHPSPLPEHPPATLNESPTQLPAPVTRPVHVTQNSSSPLALNNTLSTSQVLHSARPSLGSE